MRAHHLRNALQQTLPSPLLVLEASTSAGSVALFVNEQLAAYRDVIMGASRDDALLPAVAEVLADAGIHARAVANIACGSGPGSFTSLRIAASLAKGLAVANSASLFAIPSLLIAAAGIDRAGEYVLHSDALRGERYVLAVSIGAEGNIAAFGVTSRMTVANLTALVVEHAATSVAIGAVTVVESDAFAAIPHAKNALRLQSMWPAFGPLNVAAWEPEYGRLAEAQVKWETVHGHALPPG